VEAWKIRRELRRLQQQLQALPEFFYEPLLRRWHDARRSRSLQAQPGGVQAGNKVAIYLIFQPVGLAESTLLTCEHLTSSGYSPLVVSNAALTPADRAALLPRVWRLVERPNFGYDFGGYRDGIWLLQQWQVAPTHLILLNDSIWFPARRDDHTIQRLEDMPADFCGILKLGDDHEPTARRPRPAFLGSFFLMFKQRALDSDAFRRFWAGYRCTSNKYKTIRRGERGISAAMRGAGLGWASLFEKEHFQGLVQAASVPRLRQLLQEIVVIDAALERQRQQLIAAHDSLPKEEQVRLCQLMQDFLLKATSRSNIFSSAPISALRDLAIPFIKKAGDVPNAKGLQRLVTALDEHPGALAMTPVVERELRQWVARRG